MALNLVNQLGELNPQWFREIKGRLKPRNILIAVAVSLVGQLLMLIAASTQLPVTPPPGEYTSPISHQYCTGGKTFPGGMNFLCIRGAGGTFDINWQSWCQDVFFWMGIFGSIVLLVVGTYMLISDLSKEEHRGTLNFLRLTPQSSTSILTGKLLGVPILLYLVAVLALPLHVITGLTSQIPLSWILGYYVVLGASCLFFYSLALLFGLVCNGLGGFQAWLGSGVVLISLWSSVTLMMFGNNGVSHYPIDWLLLFNPSLLLSSLVNSISLNTFNPFYSNNLRELSWFGLPVGASNWGLAGFMVLNYGLWTYWVGQSLKRCFHNPNATVLGKQQSYWLTAGFEAVLLGFALNPLPRRIYPEGLPDGILSPDLFHSLACLLIFNLVLGLFLIVALCPQRQALQDWARYRHQNRSSRKGGVMADLIWGEKSPALVAVGLNLAIASAMLLPWIALWPRAEDKIPALWALVLNMSLIVTYAAVAQLMLLMRTPKRAAWAATTVGGLIVLPLIVCGVLSISPSENVSLWLFSPLSWMAVENTTVTSAFLAIIGQSLMLGLLSIQLTRHLHKVGESSTKALLSGRPPVAIQ